MPPLPRALLCPSPTSRDRVDPVGWDQPLSHSEHCFLGHRYSAPVSRAVGGPVNRASPSSLCSHLGTTRHQHVECPFRSSPILQAKGSSGGCRRFELPTPTPVHALVYTAPEGRNVSTRAAEDSPGPKDMRRCVSSIPSFDFVQVLPPSSLRHTPPRYPEFLSFSTSLVAVNMRPAVHAPDAPLHFRSNSIQ